MPLLGRRRARPARDRGELAILLHSHMPYVEGFGTWPFGEEWLLEAIATAYLPLLDLCERWGEDGREGVLTVGVTPVLADQLELPEVGDRFLRFMRETRASAHQIDIEALEHAGERDAADSLRHSADDYQWAAARFQRIGGDLPGALARLRDAGVIELWTSAATHAVLPLLATEAGVRLQVRTGIASHRRRFGRWSGGFWLPECAYRDGIAQQLADAGVRAFCVYLGEGADAVLGPVSTPAGPVALPIDWQMISLVWDPRGYPAHPAYRDYHATSGNGLRPWSNGGAAYEPAAAARAAGEHGRDFVARVVQRLEGFSARAGRPGLCVCALDTELLGHWWYEGPAWLRAVVEEADAAGLPLTTIPRALEHYEPAAAALEESSWGEGKDLVTWDSPLVAELAWTARRAELELLRACGPGSERLAGTARCARELLALQSSDWAFMTTRRLAADYPQRRVAGHLADLEAALASIPPGVTDSPAMSGPEGEIDARLRGLAPTLELSALVEPPSAWGRVPVEPERH